jgi:hypothetical protein
MTKRFLSLAALALSPLAPALVPAQNLLIAESGSGNPGCVAAGILLGLSILTLQPEAAAIALFAGSMNC